MMGTVHLSTNERKRMMMTGRIHLLTNASLQRYRKKGQGWGGGGIGDDDDINCIRANEDNDNDSDFDYANMSELDVSDDEVSPIHLSGRRRNKGGPRVPVKGTVSDEAYNE